MTELLIVNQPKCSACKHHSTENPVGDGDGVPVRLNAGDEEGAGLTDHESDRKLYTCRHPDQKQTSQGFWPIEPGMRAPGADCELFERGSPGRLSSRLEEMLARSAARAEKDPRKGQ